MAETVDQTARDWAQKAIAGLERHEAVCIETGEHVREELKDLKESNSAAFAEVKSAIKTLSDRWWKMAGALIVLLLGIIGWLLAHPGFGQ